MGDLKLYQDGDAGGDTQRKRRLQVVFTHQMQERQLFMEELKAYRKKRTVQIYQDMVDSVGPRWYHALSLTQRNALDKLESAMYKDLIEGRPKRTAAVLKTLGLHPKPNRVDVFSCLYHAKTDPKEFFAALYLITMGHYFYEKRLTYCFNAKLILSAIYHLGKDNIIYLLTERFKPPPVEESEPPKPKPKKKSTKSPYLDKQVAALYDPNKPKRAWAPPPLPSLHELNEQTYEAPPQFKLPPPPPPPPPPPKKVLPVGYCEKLAGIIRLEPPMRTIQTPYVKTSPKKSKSIQGMKRIRASKFSVVEMDKKAFGIGIKSDLLAKKVRKPVAPNTGIDCARYLILGVYVIKNRSYYVLGSISFQPTNCMLIHGGHKHVQDEFVIINRGFKAINDDEAPVECDCVEKWHDSVIEYLKNSKCYCGHHYDYGNEGTFPADELPFINKPTPFGGFSIDYDTVFELNPSALHVEKEIRKVWETEPLLVKDPEALLKKEKEKKKKKLKSSKTCLGDAPTPEDYLKCALQLMVRVNIAALLPDVHLVPELREWMRRRLYGPLTRHQKGKLFDQTQLHWSVLRSIEKSNRWHVSPPVEMAFRGLSTWQHTPALRRMYKTYMRNYKRSMFKNMCHVNNLFWASMCQAQYPSKRFMEIYFDYVVWRYEDLYLMNAYSSRESKERQVLFSTRRRYCPIHGLEMDASGKPADIYLRGD